MDDQAVCEANVRSDVVVVGAINLDIVVEAARLPGPGETVVGPGMQRHGGGKGANAAVAAARSGARVRLIGAVGSDDIGASALAELADEGIDVSGVVRLRNKVTGVALIVVDHAGENQIAVGAGANAALSAKHVIDTITPLLADAGCVLVSTEIPGPAVTAAVRAAAHAGVACVLNPAPPIPDVLSLLGLGPIVTPNATEAVELAGLLGHATATIEQSARAIAAASGAPVVITRGGAGVTLLASDATQHDIPPRPAEVRDTTGAGDTFNGVLACRIAAGDALERAIRVAGVAASMSVGQVGARSGMPFEDVLRSEVVALLDPVQALS